MTDAFPQPRAQEASGKSPLLTVILPVYNVEAYLRKCLDSICGQDYTNLEIICVDESSTDGSLAILREYEQRDPRVKVLTQPNAGCAAARNAALDVATGEWLTYVDPDDYLLPGAYSTTMPLATAQVDAVFFGTRVEAAAGSAEEARVPGCQSYMDYAWSGIYDTDAEHLIGVNWNLWNKLYRRSLVEKHALRHDPSIYAGSDMCWHIRFCAYAGKAHFLTTPLYAYVLRGSGITYVRSGYERRTRSFLRIFDNIAATYRKQGLITEYALWIRYLLSKCHFEVEHWSSLVGNRLQACAELIRIARSHGLHEEPGVASLLHDMERQTGTANWAAGMLDASLPAGAEGCDAGRADALHVAVPVNEAVAGKAVVLGQSLKEARGEGQSVCLHFLCDDVSLPARRRMEQLAEAEDFRICLHEVDASTLHRLPEMEGTHAHAGYLKMALPQLLPGVGRVLVLMPDMVLRGSLPDIRALDMQGLPVAVAREWPVPDRAEGQNRLKLEEYDTASVLLMDVDALRAPELRDAWVAACFMRNEPLLHPETDAFNLAFQGRKASLPNVCAWLLPAQIYSQEYDALCHRSPWADLPVEMKHLTGAGTTVASLAEAAGITCLAPFYGKLRWRYLYLQFMSALTWGRRRKRYKAKRNACRDVLRELRGALRALMAQRGI